MANYMKIKKGVIMKRILKSKNFWILTVYVLFLLMDELALDKKIARIWDTIKVRGLELKNKPNIR